MSPRSGYSHPGVGVTSSFATTHWSLVVAAADGTSPAAREAMAALCQAYWYPLYVYVRRRAYPPDDAQDLTQEFFCALLEKGCLKAADPHRGRFRSFLLASLNHFLANEKRRQGARKRGGGSPPLSLDLRSGEARYAREPSHSETPEKAYERRWALTLIDHALSAVRHEYARDGRDAVFDKLKVFLAGEHHPPYQQLATELGAQEGALKVTVHRLRRRCRDLVRAEVARTVAEPADVDDELRYLMAAVG